MAKRKARDVRIGVVYTPVEKLVPYANNAKLHTESQIADIAQSISQFGFIDPVGIDGENGIVEGHGRVMAAVKLGMKEVPTISLAHLTSAEKRAYIIAHNKLTEAAKWDTKILGEELRALALEDSISLTFLGIPQPELTPLLAQPLGLPNLGGDEGGTAERKPSSAAQMQPVEDEKRDYKQVPPEDRERAIKASEDRIPLPVLLNRAEWEKWEAFKAESKLKSDKDAFCKLMGWPMATAPSANPAADSEKPKRGKSK